MKRLELLLPPPVVALIFAALAWGLSKYLPFADYPWEGRTTLVFLCTAVGGLFGMTGILRFWKRRTTIDPHRPTDTTKLVTNGIYRYTRNPMYLGLVFVLLAWTLYLQNFTALLAIPLFMGYLTRFQIMPEERILKEKFKEDYTNYLKKVRRWF